jgi:hypothetical protein
MTAELLATRLSERATSEQVVCGRFVNFDENPTVFWLTGEAPLRRGSGLRRVLICGNPPVRSL